MPSKTTGHELSTEVTQLYQSAQRFAQGGAADLAAGRHDDAMAKVGVALEHMAKAFLVSEHPLLVVAVNRGVMDAEGMRWALGRPLSGSRGFTINASEAVRRCCIVLPELSENDMRPVLAARNGVLHTAHAAGGDADLIVSQVARAADVLLPKIGRTSEGLWGHYLPAVMERRNARRTEASQRVADKMAVAKDNWELTFKRLGVEGINALHLAGQHYHFSGDEEQIECPACSGPAVGSGSLAIQEVPEYDHDGPDWYVSNISSVPWNHLDQLKCLACGLFLETRDELEAAGLDVIIESSHELDAEIF